MGPQVGPHSRITARFFEGHSCFFHILFPIFHSRSARFRRLVCASSLAVPCCVPLKKNWTRYIGNVLPVSGAAAPHSASGLAILHLRGAFLMEVARQRTMHGTPESGAAKRAPAILFWERSVWFLDFLRRLYEPAKRNTGRGIFLAKWYCDTL